MIVKGNEFRRNAYFISKPAAAALTTLSSGQMVMENAAGEVVLCDGTVRGYMAFSDKTATKDNVTPAGGIVSYAVGDVIVTLDTDSFVTGHAYAFGSLLKSTNAGKLDLWDKANDAVALICAEAMGAEVNGTLRVRQK